MEASPEGGNFSFMASMRSRAIQLVDAARHRAAGLLGAAKEKACTVRGQVDQKAAAATGFVSICVSKAQSIVQDAKGKMHSCVSYAQATLAVTYEGLRKKGARSWVVDGASDATRSARTVATALASTASEKYATAKKHTLDHTTSAAEIATAKVVEFNTTVRGIAADKKFQVSAASAMSGAVTLGASGGATGLAAGGAIGTAVGLVPALFTFGFSIPIGAAIGSGLGLAVGTAVGGTVGTVGGGAAGYGAYSKKEGIGKCAEYLKAKATETTEFVNDSSTATLGCARGTADFTKAKAFASAVYVADKASAAKCRLLGRSGTGGTKTAD